MHVESFENMIKLKNLRFFNHSILYNINFFIIIKILFYNFAIYWILQAKKFLRINPVVTTQKIIECVIFVENKTNRLHY